MLFVRLTLVIATCAIFAAGCTTPPKQIDTSPTAELSFDGLYPVTNTRSGVKVWSRRDFDLSGYTKILPLDVGVEYRPVRKTGTSIAMRSSDSVYPISENVKKQIEETFRAAFLEELGKTRGFELVTQPGPDVLVVRGYLLDVISKVPPDPVGGRSDVFLSSVGEATLVIELVDAQSEATLLRAAQRKNAETQSMTGLVWTSTVTGMVEVRRLAKDWARLLRIRLEELKETQGIGSAG